MKSAESQIHGPGRHRVGCVSYLNSKPLIHGLARQPRVDLSLRVPARLLDGLAEGSFDVALLPVIDYQRLDGLRVVPSAGIGCDGPTLTVRIFSNKPIEQITMLACDGDSHTSVALARIVLAERYNLHPEFVDLSRRPALPAAQLLIGDKVVCEEPAGMPYQLDLGAAWKELTGMPFVFAVWVARQNVDLLDLPQTLAQCKRDGLAHIDDIIRDHAVPRGWPAGLALQYLTVYLKYDIGPRQLDAIRLFHQLAAKHHILPQPLRPLVI